MPSSTRLFLQQLSELHSSVLICQLLLFWVAQLLRVIARSRVKNLCWCFLGWSWVEVGAGEPGTRAADAARARARGAPRVTPASLMKAAAHALEAGTRQLRQQQQRLHGAAVPFPPHTLTLSTRARCTHLEHLQLSAKWFAASL
jgi:hypothetical protein